MDSIQLQFLQKQGFPPGLIQALISQKEAFPLRVWILDNSIYMDFRDAHIIRGNYQNLVATRWEELQDCVAYHAHFAATLGMPVRFALVNDPNISGVPQYFSLHQSGNLNIEQETLHRVMTFTKPAGPNLLTNQLNVLRDYIASIAPQLREKNQIVSVILATQGLPTDANLGSPPNVIQDFVTALSSFGSLPVWMVLRLCTDDDKAIDFFNSIDKDLVHFDIDVLDDWFGEAVEVYLRNPWLTYGLVLHRFREMGFRTQIIDKIDERALTPYEIRDLCSLLFGYHQYPDPVHNWHGFLQTVSEVMGREQVQWNPITKCAAPWLNLALLNALHAPQTIPVRAVPPPQGSTGSGFLPNVGFSPQSHTQTANKAPGAAAPEVQSSYSSSSLLSSSSSSSKIQNPDKVKEYITTRWAKHPPRYDSSKSIEELLTTVDSTFQLVEPHEYFQEKFHPFSKEALSSGNPAILQRAVRKMKFFLHPDKLPKTLNEQQVALCRSLWDVTSEAWEAHPKGN